ncbi:MAG: 6-carboxytetrahydropterin synthase [Desulfobacteraceae bacterium]|nr:6-carboxytetrahydropterin synthase [Desulfobacteraceae bacterium]
MLSITKEFTFHAAHRLLSKNLSDDENQRIFGDCTKLHGHSYRLRVTLAGTADENGLILNFSSLKEIVQREILTRYDHADLNSLAEYHEQPPTVENMVCTIFRNLDEALSCERFSLESVTLFETATCWATKSRHA